MKNMYLFVEFSAEASASKLYLQLLKRWKSLNINVYPEVGIVLIL